MGTIFKNLFHPLKTATGKGFRGVVSLDFNITGMGETSETQCCSGFWPACLQIQMG